MTSNMYIMYVDDSGTPHLSDESQYYVISGIIINASDLFFN